MKIFIVLSVLVAFTAAAAGPILSPEEREMLEAFDYDALFANDEQRILVFDCLLDKGSCGDYKKFADVSLRLIASNCAGCSPAQKDKFEKVLKNLHDKYEPFYNELMKKIAAKKE